MQSKVFVGRGVKVTKFKSTPVLLGPPVPPGFYSVAKGQPDIRKSEAELARLRMASNRIATEASAKRYRDSLIAKGLLSPI